MPTVRARDNTRLSASDLWVKGGMIDEPSGWVVELGGRDDPFYLTIRGVWGTIATASWFATREDAERAAHAAGCPDASPVGVTRQHGIAHLHR